MEIGTMSAEELAASFSKDGQNQQTQQSQQQSQQAAPAQKVGENFQNFQKTEISDKSAEELAAEFANGTQKPNESTEGTKTPEQIAKEAEDAKKATEGGEDKPPVKTKIDDSFKQGLDKLFKEDKLSPFSDGTEAGYIVPETFEDVLDLIEENKKTWVESAKAKDRDELVSEILATKSPAWQFLIEQSEKYKDPADLVPLLTAVQNQEYSNSLDPTNEDDQIKIIRASLSLQGLTTESIEDEVADLKERGKLAKRAEDLKPMLDKFNARQTATVVQKKAAEDAQTEAFWNTHYQNLENTVFKSKEIDGVKLKNEHKQMIAATLIQDDKIGGLPIYTIIDNLIAAGDLKTLSKIALMGLDSKLFDTYFLTGRVDAKVEGIQRVLRQQGTSSGGSNEQTQDDTKVKTIKKSQYGFFG